MVGGSDSEEGGVCPGCAGWLGWGEGRGPISHKSRVETTFAHSMQRVEGGVSNIKVARGSEGHPAQKRPAFSAASAPFDPLVALLPDAHVVPWFSGGLPPLLSLPTRLRGSLCVSVTSRSGDDVWNIKARTDAPLPTRTEVHAASHSRSATCSMMSPRFSLLVIAAGLTDGALRACTRLRPATLRPR
jgi:hypothetical protein